MVENLPELQKTWVYSLVWEDPLEKGMATHSSILAWRIPMEGSPWGWKELDTTERLSTTGREGKIFWDVGVGGVFIVFLHKTIRMTKASYVLVLVNYFSYKREVKIMILVLWKETLRQILLLLIFLLLNLGSPKEVLSMALLLLFIRFGTTSL